MDNQPTSASLMFRFINEIHIIAQLSGNAVERAMPEGMTLPQFSVLNHLIRLGGDRTPLQIANAMQVTKGAMTNTLGHLSTAGAISIRPDSRDGRSKRVDITDAGRALHARTLQAMLPEMDFLGDSVTPEEIAGALPLLERMRKLLDERRNQTSSAPDK